MSKELDMNTRRNVLKKLAKEYSKANKVEKTKILDKYIQITGHNRKYIITELNNPNLLKPRLSINSKKHEGRYKGIEKVLEKIWNIFGCQCGQRLESTLKSEIRRLSNFKEISVSEEEIKKLETISSATIDRKLASAKKESGNKLYCTTKPGYLLKSQIEIRLNDWDQSKIGYAEIDLVAHCGSSTHGQYVNSLSFVDVASGWWEGEAVMGKSALVVKNGLDKINRRLPFKLMGIDSDNGSEFINEFLFQYCGENKMQFTRGRPGQKNDNCYVEQKNWTHVRKLLGYKRFDINGELDLINSLYRNELRLYYNFFQPSYKLESKTWNHSKRKRKYEKKLKTPYQRLLESGNISEPQKEILRKIYNNLNPAELKRKIDKILFVLGELNNKKYELKTIVAAQNG